ncbi:MAG: DUF7684 family protein [Terriglobales bacterium]
MVARLLGIERLLHRAIYLAEPAQLWQFAFGAEFPSGHFVSLLAANTCDLPAGHIADFCDKLLRHGCAYLCAWGPDCERVHDVMDQTVVGPNPPATDRGCVMTAWHSCESIEQTAEFFLCSTLPDEEFAPGGCALSLIIAVGNLEWSRTIETTVQASLRAR